MYLRRLLHTYLWPYRVWLLWLIALQLVAVLAALYLPSLNADIIDTGVAKGNTDYIIRAGMIMLGVAFVQVACTVGVASAERVFELLNAEEEPVESGAVPWSAERHGRVEFEGVSFRYDPDTPLITDLSVVADPGHTVAIVGPTGAGKTTLVNLVMRFYDLDSGRITLDGVDVSQMRRADLRGQIGMVLQDTWLFEGTIRDADLILVMEAGRVVEQGTHGALLLHDGAYAALYHTQLAEPAVA